MARLEQLGLSRMLGQHTAWFPWDWLGAEYTVNFLSSVNLTAQTAATT
jgi:hypothetical protein